MSIVNCKKCVLHKYRRNVVFGRGCIPADICMIAEAPGQTEDLTGKSFTGKAGVLLDRMIDDARRVVGLKRIRIYFTNTVLCRPCDYIGGPNRQPTKEEAFLCSENVNAIITKTNARAFILCGEIAEKYMKNIVMHYTKIMHPAAILRHGGASSGYYLQTVRILEKLFRSVYL